MARKRPIQAQLNFWEKESDVESSVRVSEVREETTVHDDGLQRDVHQDVRDLPAQTVVLYLPSLAAGLRRERDEWHEEVLRDVRAIHQEYSWFDEAADEWWIEFWCERIERSREMKAICEEQLERMNERIRR